MRRLLQIESYATAHEAACREVLRQVFGDDDQSHRYHRLTPGRTVVAMLQDRIIGFGSIWDNSNHPHALRSGVVVLPPYRRQGVGSHLWEALLQVNREGRALVTSLWETQLAGQAFAVRCGFREMRRTYTALLPIAHVDTTAFQRVHEGLASQGYRMLSYGDAREHERAQMAALLQHTYTAAHAANPVRPFSVAEWAARAFPDDLLAWGSFAVMHGNACVAVALLHAAATPGQADLGWRGVADAHQHRSRPLMIMTAVRQMAEAAARGFTQLSLECDSTDPWSRDVLDAFPFGPAPTWITLRRDSGCAWGTCGSESPT